MTSELGRNAESSRKGGLLWALSLVEEDSEWQEGSLRCFPEPLGGLCGAGSVLVFMGSSLPLSGEDGLCWPPRRRTGGLGAKS